ncbi:MAG: M42 family metallopeptidase [FCB group bacterium]|jgi:endoglucanase|nr:M42 family metallopeptidase [FCB group bacterium]
MQSSIDLLRELTEADGVPGFEDEVRDIFTRRLEGVGEILRDRTGSVACRKVGKPDGPRIMLDCHLDEVGFIIRHILPNGFLRFLPLGGWWNHTLPAQRVRVHAANGNKIPGVIGSTPPHYLSEEKRKKVLDTADLFIDIGASSRVEAESWGLRVGNWAAPDSPFTRLTNEKLLMAKAFDNRVGTAVCIEAAQRIENHPNILYANASVQEEVGYRGAITMSRIIEPGLAIVLEGPPADDTPGFKPDESQGALGRGVQIRAYDPKMISNPRLLDFALDIAHAENIPHQLAVRSSGSTNSAAIHTSHHGVPTLVLGVPTRYIHAHTGIINTDDYTAMLELVLALLARLDGGCISNFPA